METLVSRLMPVCEPELRGGVPKQELGTSSGQLFSFPTTG
jgi:hypothetical protein